MLRCKCKDKRGRRIEKNSIRALVLLEANKSSIELKQKSGGEKRRTEGDTS